MLAFEADTSINNIINSKYYYTHVHFLYTFCENINKN